MSAALGVRVLGDDVRVAEAALRRAGLRIARTRVDVILSHGGDGTLLRSERDAPGVPKVPARLERRAQLCDEHRLDAIVGRLRAGALERETLDKIELRVGHGEFLALNDVVMRNRRVTSAVRFRLRIDGEPVAGEITGDGVVFATPFGSTAYYRSITRGAVRSGVGVAFNNTTEQVEHFVVGNDATIDVEITRGPAELVFDNTPRAFVLRDGARFSVRRSQETAEVWGLDALRCRACRKLSGETFNPH